MRAERTYYEVLGVEATATAEQLKDAYRRLLRQTHPDTGGSPALFDLVTEAFNTLKDPASRAAYDAALQGRGPTDSERQQADSASTSSATGEEPQPETEEQREPPTHAARTALPYDPRPAMKSIWETALGALVLLVLPFAFFGRTEDPYSYSDKSHISGFGWFLLGLMVLVAVNIARQAWDIVRPSRWSAHAWRWEAGPDVARALTPKPPPPPGGGVIIGWHLSKAVMTLGMSSFWHLARAGMAAEKAAQRSEEWRARCASIEAQAEAARPSASASLAALELRYERRRPWGSAHRRSIEARRAFVSSVLAYLNSTPDAGAAGSPAAATVHLRTPLHAVGLAGLGIVLTAGIITGGVAVASNRIRNDSSVTEAARPSASPLPVTTAPTPGPPNSDTASSTSSASPTSAAPAVATVAPPAEPTCASLKDVRATYTVATRQLEAGVEKWPRVTVHNPSAYTVLPHFSGGGKASSPDFPEFPLEMSWPDYDSKPVRHGSSRTFNVGEDTGSILYVPPGGKILRFDVSVTVDDDAGQFRGCRIPVKRQG